MLKSFLISIGIVLLSSVGVATNKDSLEIEKLYKLQATQSPNDTAYWGTNIQLASYYADFQYDSLAAIARRTLLASKKFKALHLQGSALHLIGHYYYRISDFEKAIDYFTQALLVRKQAGREKEYANTLMQMGNAYNSTADYDKACQKYFDAIELFESQTDSAQLSKALCNLGLAYTSMKNTKSALQYLNRGLAIDEILGDTLQLATSYNNIGGVYQNIASYDTALIYFEKALVLYKQIGYQRGLAHGYNNMAIVYYYRDNIDTSLKYFERAYEMRKKIGGKMDIAQSLNNLGIFYSLKEDYTKAIEYSLESYEMAKSAKLKEEMTEAADNLANVYYEKGDFKQSADFLRIYAEYRDSIYTDDTKRVINELQTKYETEKKEKELEVKDLQLQQNQTEFEKQRAQKRLMYVGLGALVLVIGLVVYRYKEKQKANTLLELQKKEIEEKNEEITDSIEYAKRIQSAVLKSEEHETEHLPEHFILFKPKDIVSGDFYWAKEVGDWFYVCVADCTGHGVPGAFMSMLGISFLNDILSDKKDWKPNDILDQLRHRVINELSQTGKIGGSKDGMDISLVKINLKSRHIEWAGANNPLYIIRKGTENQPVITTVPQPEVPNKFRTLEYNNNSLYELAPDKQPISYWDYMKPFKCHFMQLNEGDCLYLFSDGYADQFGGEKGKKFMYKPFKRLVLGMLNHDMKTQKQHLNSAFEKWQKDYEQIDDVCVFGIRL